MAKTALVTGATSGIGKAIAIALAGAGYEVLAVGRNRDALDELRALDPTIRPLRLDVKDRAAVEEAVRGLHVDVLVNNAGIMPPLGHFADIDVAAIDAAIDLNLTATLFMTRMIVPQMRERGSGHVVFTGSTAGHLVVPNMALYSATKAAISGFAASLRGDLAPYGVRVTEIVPGRTETPLYKGVIDEAARTKMYADDAAVQPEDIAAVLVTVLGLPAWADVTRFDIVPTRPSAPAGAK
ncbi:MAG: SDR family oxidoreductase [Aquamicrobium sp.]|uniref:SDR family oxidoreductase n=1 Tax=Aquamicrobium sp. TaxID=1872579 RepID=UPI00349E8BDB|nr:SDR family oxidoreductase [Aquamicrobium sp.]